MNTNETTDVQEVDEITDANTNTPGVQENPPHRTVCRDRHKEKYVMPCLQSLPSR